jgi:hypothetical protein
MLRLKRALAALAGAAVLAAVLAPPAMAMAPPAALGLQVQGEPVQGEAVTVEIVLLQQSGRPLSDTVTIYEVARFFSYTGRIKVGEVRTNSLGRATLKYTPTAYGQGGLVAEYAGGTAAGAAAARTSFMIQRGKITPVAAQPELLPRGVTPIWLLALLVGVWVSVGIALYHLARIPGEREESGLGA